MDGITNLKRQCIAYNSNLEQHEYFIPAENNWLLEVY